MAGPSHPTTTDDAFARTRRAFVPRLLLAFALYAAVVYAPELIDAGRSFLERLEPTPPAPFTPPAILPPTADPAARVVEPVLDPARGVWVLDQQFSSAYESIQVGGRVRIQAIAQTFRPPDNGTALQLIGLSLGHAEEGLRVSLIELDGIVPGEGRRVFARTLPRYVRGVNEEPEILILPQLPVDPDRTYALILRPSPGRDAGVHFLTGEDVYAEGTPWFQDRSGSWQSYLGEMTFRLEFLAVG